MSAFNPHVRSGPKLPDCEWCGLRVATTRVYATDACAECADGGRTARIKAYQERLKRAASRKDSAA